MMAWLNWLTRPRRQQHEWPVLGPLVDPRPFAGPAEYLPLHKYLRDRYADTVVLTFGEIEDLLGFSLPAPARLQPEWWTDAGAAPTAPSRSWSQACRTVRANFASQTAVFERASA
jgi:hypothetical protein